MSQTTVHTSHIKILNIYKYFDWQGRDIYLFVWWHPGEARGLWFPWWGPHPSFCHRFDRAELVCWSIGTTWQIKQCFIFCFEWSIFLIMILMLQGNDQISVCNRPGLHSIPHHCSPLLNTTPLLSSDCSSADDDHREGQDDNDSKSFYSQSPQSGITLILIFCDPPHHDHDHLSLYHHWIFSLIGPLPIYVSSCYKRQLLKPFLSPAI